MAGASGSGAAGPGAGALPIGVSRVQRRTMIVLVGTQTATGLGFAAAFAVSNLLAAQLSGSKVIGGAASTMMLAGSAVSAYALATVAARRGRRPALALGSLLSGVGAVGAAVAVAAGSWLGLLAAMVPFGAAIATSLAARFAATDLADPRRVGRQLAVVLWALTVGVLVGPNLADASQRWAGSLGLAPAAGPYLLSAVAFGVALLGTVAGLRPDPLLVRREGAALQVLPGLTIATTGGSSAQLTAGLILLGLGWSAGLVGGSALLVETVPVPDRPAVQGFSDMTMSASGALGGLLAGVAVAVWSYPLLGLVAAVLSASLVLTAVVTSGRSVIS